ncbi:MAG: hypothetical protein CYG59_00800 [Chloroflexi bacterium]|nr:MAG: hypothetical protein CYG59_00800 [Chloroflexota bacterium]
MATSENATYVILVVEDDADIRNLIHRMLHRSGYTVVTAEHGRAALTYLDAAAQLPCLMLLDLEMPVMDGRRVVSELSARRRLRSLPIVLMSANPAGKTVARDLRTAGFLSKPFDRLALLTTVRTIQYAR